MADNSALPKISGRLNLPYYYYYHHHHHHHHYHYHYYGDDDDDDVFNKPLMEFFIRCFYVVPSSTTTAPPTEQTTKTTSSEKISSTGNETPEGKLGRSASQRRKGNQKTGLKNTSVKILFSLALLSGLFTAPLLKTRLLCFFSF